MNDQVAAVPADGRGSLSQARPGCTAANARPVIDRAAEVAMNQQAVPDQLQHLIDQAIVAAATTPTTSPTASWRAPRLLALGRCLYDTTDRTVEPAAHQVI
jgi:hypothetical protein